MQEQWRPVREFPHYLVSSLGQVQNSRTGQVLRRTLNQQGILRVNLVMDGNVFTRSVNVMVAQAFLPKPPRADFITAIHLDGNKSNCRVDNLAWRPRAFAVKYHSQFRSRDFQTARIPVIDIKSNVVYQTAQEAAILHGLLFTDIIASAHNRTYVWPTYQEFRIMSD